MVRDAAKKEGFMADSKKRTVVVMPWRDGKPEETKRMFENMTVTTTGKSNKVAGYACEIYLSKNQDDNSTGEICITKGISNVRCMGFCSVIHRVEEAIQSGFET